MADRQRFLRRSFRSREPASADESFPVVESINDASNQSSGSE